MAAHKFKAGDSITNGIVTKTVLELKDDHYLTNCGRVDFSNEQNWKKI